MHYSGKVVSIAKFGAFINILPGRDGLLHISKLGAGKRVERVEDYLEMGQDLMVRVDDVDPSGKISLSLVGAGGDESASAPKTSETTTADAVEFEQSGGSERTKPESEAKSSPASSVVSFEAHFDEELRSEYGDLGPGPSPSPRSSDREGGHGKGPRRSGRRDGRR